MQTNDLHDRLDEFMYAIAADHGTTEIAIMLLSAGVRLVEAEHGTDAARMALRAAERVLDEGSAGALN